MGHYTVLKELSERTKNGHISAGEAATLAVRHGAILIGTAQSQEGYTPSILLSSHFRNEDGSPKWDLMYPTPRGGAVSAIRASRIADTAIWSAYGGDANHSLQRLCIDKSFFPNPEQYDFGTHGWKYNQVSGRYALQAHEDLLQQTRDIDDESVIGDVDLVIPSKANMQNLPEEPGHAVVFSPQEVVASLAVRMGDVRQLRGVESYYYEPLSS